MTKLRVKRIKRPTLCGYLLTALLCLTIILTFYGQTVGAVTTGASNINMFKRGSSGNLYDLGTGERGTVAVSGPIGTTFVRPEFATCKARFYLQIIDRPFLEQHVSKYIAEMQNFGENATPTDAQQWLSRFGPSVLNGISTTNSIELEWIMNGYGHAMPAIEFVPTDDGISRPIDSGLSPKVPDDSDVCKDFRMVSVSRFVWKGYQATQETSSTTAGGKITQQYMTFAHTALAGSTITDYGGTNAVGTLSYQFYDGSLYGTLQYPAWVGKTHDVAIDGYPDFSSLGSISTSSLGASWVNVSTISMPYSASSSKFAGDIYKKKQWGGDSNTGNLHNGLIYAYYFLDSNPIDAARASLASSGSQNTCDYPLPRGSPCNSGGQNCTPFITVGANLDLNEDFLTAGLARLQSEINRLPSVIAYLYDYNADCSTGGTWPIVSFGNSDRSKVWFVYSLASNAFRTVWDLPQGTGIEGPYNAVYESVVGQYKGGPNGCNGSIAPGTINTTSAVPFDVQWTFWDNTCKVRGPTLIVKAIAGGEGEAAFNAPPEDLDTPATTSTQINCDVTLNPLTWIICPIIAGAQGLIDQLDNGINSMLNVDVEHYFDETCSPKGGGAFANKGGGCAGSKFYKAWGSMRFLAVAVIVVAALIMIIAQALGLEVLSPYTYKKMLPIALVIVIAIPLSWDIAKALITISATTGLGVRNIIYAPFADPLTGVLTIDAGSGVSTAFGLVGGAALLGLGIFGVLSLVVPALLGVLVGFGVLMFRQLAIIALVVVSPVLLVLLVLPFSRKIGGLGLGLFAQLLAAAIAIWAVIATARDFSSVMAEAGGILFQVGAVIVYFLPYFLFLKIITLTGGAMAWAGKLGGNMTQGISAGVQKWRGNRFKHNMDLLKAGERFNTKALDGRMGRRFRWLNPLSAINSIGARVGTIPGEGGGLGMAVRSLIPSFLPGVGRWGQRARTQWEYRMAAAGYADPDVVAQNNPGLFAQKDNGEVMMAHYLHEDRRAMGRLRVFQRRDSSGNPVLDSRGNPVLDQEKADRAIAGSLSIPATDKTRRAAGLFAARAGDIYGAGTLGGREMRDLIAYSSGNNRTLYTMDMALQRSQGARDGSRADLKWIAMDQEDIAQTGRTRAVADASEAYASASVLTAQMAQQLNEPAAVGVGQGIVQILTQYSNDPTGFTIYDKHLGGNRALTQAEAQHLADILIALLNNPNGTAYQQGTIRDAVQQAEALNYGFMTQAQLNMLAKINPIPTLPLPTSIPAPVINIGGPAA